MKKSKKRKKKTCGSKIGHKDRDGAYGEMRSIKKRTFIYHKMNVYKCPYCGKWHVGRSKEILYDKFDKLTKKRL